MIFKFQTELQIHKHLNKFYPNLELTPGLHLSSSSPFLSQSFGTLPFPSHARRRLSLTRFLVSIFSRARALSCGRCGHELSPPLPSRPCRPPLLARERRRRVLTAHLPRAASLAARAVSHPRHTTARVGSARPAGRCVTLPRCP